MRCHAHTGDGRSKDKNEEGPGDCATLPADGESSVSLERRNARQVEFRHIAHYLLPTGTKLDDTLLKSKSFVEAIQN